MRRENARPVPQGADRLSPGLWWILAGLTLVWGFNWTALKVAVGEMQPFSFRAVCLAFGSGVMFAWLRATGQQMTIPREHWPRLAAISFFAITCWNLLVVYGLALIPSGRAAILAYTMPAWSIPLSVLLLGERMDGRKVLGLALGMAGMGLLLWDEVGRLQKAPLGALLVLAAAVAWAVGTVLQKRYPVRAPLLTYTTWLLFVGGIPVYLGAFLLEDLRKLAEVSLWPALATLYNIFLAFAWANWACIMLATRLSVTVFSLSMLTVPIVAVFCGFLILGERPGWPEFGALAFVVASLVTVMAPARR